MSGIFSMWSFWVFVVVLVLAVRSALNPDPRQIMSDHVMFVHATLGMGKTALAAYWVWRVLHPYGPLDHVIAKLFRRPLPPVPVVYSTFDLSGAAPLDLRTGIWPSTRGAKFVIDEVLLLESNDLLPLPWFSRGGTMARQYGQQITIISQTSRLPKKLAKFHGVIGLFMTMKGFSLGKFGRIIILKRASEPFIRRSKGYKSDGQKTSIVFIPGKIFATYNSRKIYGYTVELDGTWIDAEAASNAAGVDNQGAAHVTDAPRAAGAAHVTKMKPKRVHRVRPPAV